MNDIGSNGIAKNASNIIGYLRKSNNISFEELGSILECSRFRAARIENGKALPNITEWVNLSSHFKLPPNCLNTGLIEIPSDSDIQKFRINKRYRSHLFSTGNVINMHSACFKKILGSNAFDELCKLEGIDPLYLINLNNPLNLSYSMVLLKFMIAKRKVQKSSLSSYANISQKFICSLFLDKGYNITKTKGIERIFLSLKNSHLLEKNHEYVINDYSFKKRFVVTSFRPREHVDLNEYKGLLLNGFFCNYIPSFQQHLSNVDLHIEKHACFNKGDNFCTYRFTEVKKNI